MNPNPNKTWYVLVDDLISVAKGRSGELLCTFRGEIDKSTIFTGEIMNICYGEKDGSLAVEGYDVYVY